MTLTLKNRPVREQRAILYALRNGIRYLRLRAFAILVAVCSLLAGMDQSRAAETGSASGIPDDLIKCCFQGPLYEREGGIYKFKEPISLYFINLADLKGSDIDAPLSLFFQRLTSESHIFTISKKMSLDEDLESPLVFFALPRQIEQLSDLNRVYMMRIMQHVFSNQSDLKIDTAYIDAALKTVYSYTDDKYGSFMQHFDRTDQGKTGRAAAVVMARMSPDLKEQLFSIEINIFQAMNYNNDGSNIDDSIFSGHNWSATSKDFDLISYIYREKAINIVKLRP